MSIKSIIQNMAFINEPYTRWKWRERRVSWGKENPDKVFFVIRRATCKVGLFSYVMTNMGLVKYALDKGYVPVIDMCSNANTYLEESQIGNENAWEFYFEQPCGYCLKDIAKSKNVILSDGLITEHSVYPDKMTAWDEQNCIEWRKLFSKYLIVKKEIRDEAVMLYKMMFGTEKTVGVLARGTDYVNNRPHNHPVQPAASDMIDDVQKLLENRNCRWVYLATEDDDIYNQFVDAFADRLKVTQAKRCQDTGSRNINDISYERENDRYLKGREYLINVLLLSMCDCLVAGNVGGTLGALLMTDGYEYQQVYQLGVYA